MEMSFEFMALIWLVYECFGFGRLLDSQFQSLPEKSVKAR